MIMIIGYLVKMMEEFVVVILEVVKVKMEVAPNGKEASKGKRCFDNFAFGDQNSGRFPRFNSRLFGGERSPQ